MENILSLGLIIQQTVAITFELRICHLLTEFIANALGRVILFETAGTVSACALETLLDSLHYLGIFVKAYLAHLHSSIRLRTVALSAYPTN